MTHLSYEPNMIKYMKPILFVVNVCSYVKIIFIFHSYFLLHTLSDEETFFNSHSFLNKVNEFEKKSELLTKKTNDESI